MIQKVSCKTFIHYHHLFHEAHLVVVVAFGKLSCNDVNSHLSLNSKSHQMHTQKKFVQAQQKKREFKPSRRRASSSCHDEEIAISFYLSSSKGTHTGMFFAMTLFINMTIHSILPAIMIHSPIIQKVIILQFKVLNEQYLHPIESIHLNVSKHSLKIPYLIHNVLSYNPKLNDSPTTLDLNHIPESSIQLCSLFLKPCT